MAVLSTTVRDYRLGLMRDLMDREGYDALAFTQADFFQFATNFATDVQTWERPIVCIVPRNGAPFAVLLPERAPDLQDVPTLRESGIATPTMPGWYALVGPAGLPDDVTLRLNAALQATLADAAVRQRLRDLYLTPVPGAPATIRDLYERDSAFWGAFIQRRGLRLG